MNEEQACYFWDVLDRIARALESLVELAESAAQAPNDEEG
jgi:hypothetical protein